MNIAMLTTWSSACGIAEYSKSLVEEFITLKHKVLLLTNKSDPYLHEKNILVPNFQVVPVFGVHWWGENPAFDFPLARHHIIHFEKENGPIDVFHIQYQSSLYEPEGFNELISFLVDRGTKVVMTQHDSSINPKHDFFGVDAVIVHNKEIGHSNYIPFPVIETVPIAFSFGMGRNDYSFIRDACEEIGVSFDCHDARKDGWLTEEDLLDRMSQADVIILWYNEVGIHGQSAALRTAISSCRPVIVNDVSWFKDAPPFVCVVENKLELQEIIIDILNLKYIRDNSFENCAKQHLEIYNG